MQILNTADPISLKISVLSASNAIPEMDLFRNRQSSSTIWALCFIKAISTMYHIAALPT